MARSKQSGRKGLDEARAAFRRAPTPQNEERLVRAAAGRARELAGQGQLREAEQLLQQVRERHPGCSHLLEDAGLECEAAAGNLDGVLRQLLDPGREEAARALLASLVVDPAEVARAAALPADHPLRREAAALSAAFEAVTSGPVPPERIALPEVSRRSPLAPWKMAVRALEAWHRGDDEGCRRSLAALPEGSAPGRLARPLLDALAGRAPARSLRQDLEDLDRLLAAPRAGPALKRAAEVMARVRREAPEAGPRLAQDLAVRLQRRGLPEARVHQALGGPPLRDARWFRLEARALEMSGEVGEAALAWEAFREAASLSGLEEAAVLQQQAWLLAALPPGDLMELQRRRGVRLHPLDLYRRAAALDPHPESFSAWLDHARLYRGDEDLQAARAWSRKHPGDLAPLLFQARRAQGRGAFQEARRLLDRAEEADPLDPAARRLRREVDLEFALRHLRQGKYHLLERDLASLEARRADHGPDLDLLLPLFRWAGHAASGHTRGAGEESARLEAAAGSVPVARALQTALGAAVRRPVRVPGGGPPPLAPAARAFRVAREAGIPFAVPEGWVKPLAAQLLSSTPPPGDLHALAEAGLQEDHSLPLAAAAIRRGLELPAPWTARFLVLRADLLADGSWQRRRDCLRAALELARREGDPDTVRRALAELRSGLGGAPGRMDEAEVAEVLQAEREGRGRSRPEAPECDCPVCRAERFLDEEDEEDLKALRELAERLRQAAEAFSEGPAPRPAPPAPARRERSARRREPVGQGLLFEEAV